MSHNLWDDRFSAVQEKFLYGTRPNAWIRHQLPTLSPQARVLALADGEGRNSVWLAQQGYMAENWDYSLVGLEKTRQLAHQSEVLVHTKHIDLLNYPFESPAFDAIVSSFFHLPKAHQLAVWQAVAHLLAPEGKLVLQVFAESQLGRSSGGPKDITLLYRTDVFQDALSPIMAIDHLEETEVLLDEGHLHQGYARVINLHATKIA